MAIMVLIVDNEENARTHIGAFLQKKGYETQGVATLAAAKECLNQGMGDVILLDVQLDDGYGPDLLYEIEKSVNRPPVILFTGYGDIDMAVEAMKNGAHDFFEKPVDLVKLEKSIQRAYEIVSLRRELDHFRKDQREKATFVIGSSKEMQNLVVVAQKAAEASVSILIEGETGSGKEVLARFIHQCGLRKGKPFIAINCAAIQPTMLESELFGYEAGAFTGAERRKIGLMEVADEGVLFLDEIASMPMDIQAKLLRALEERAFRRVGGTTMIKVDVQILAASNRNLAKLIENQEFRSDLYYRLKVVDLYLPPLRTRKDDIPELIGYFIKHFNPRLGLNVNDVTPRALQALKDYSWPGNIRELSNAIERAMLFSENGVIDLPNLPENFSRKTK
jgi:two-component system, NtrC family, response regulator AtoC